jgi:hypothetical protein
VCETLICQVPCIGELCAGRIERTEIDRVRLVCLCWTPGFTRSVISAGCQ